ncbi:MAG: LysR family transcriptional regulator [Sphingomonadaceae bacterium]|nr:LysR family transcriptional regulator [Sphingomonadaceae bacterium]
MDKFVEMEIFADVVARGSFSATARAKSLSPSGVSKLIHRLETRLGILLFKRDTRQVALTPEGHQYHEGVQRVLSAMAELEAQNDAAVGLNVTGQLKILCSSSLATRVIIPFVTEFSELYPGLDIEFVVRPVASFQSLDPAIDLAFYSAEMPSSSLIARRIVTTQHVICAAPSYLAKWGTPTTPDQLADHRCMNFSMEAPCNHWPMQMPNGEMRRMNIRPQIVADNSEILLSLACNGAGIGRFSTFQARADISAGRLVPVLEEYNPRIGQAIYAVYHSRRYVSHRIQVFLDFIESRLAAAEAPPPIAVPKMRLVSARD